MGSCPDTDIDPFQIGCHGKIQKAKMEKEKRKTQERKKGKKLEKGKEVSGN